MSEWNGEIPADMRIVDRWSVRRNAFVLVLQKHGPTRRTISTRRQLYGWRTIHEAPETLIFPFQQRNYLMSYVRMLMTPIPRSRYDPPPLRPRRNLTMPVGGTMKQVREASKERWGIEEAVRWAGRERGDSDD
ncbi:hypothetical protein SEA_SKOG_73 [Gordonia phage Skog]|uniref:Uncharacterized protein n=1 Tax=Gordonia phage Skog TaxID=2704033 RepID=A0A6G6XK48_9CAUD|nr:hypothetical protein KHQ85_gp073 [Gordonia phage Skog]QIG58225.1 hypothetical protein SEA_SKOG_73 [Gordonia phage Skog]